MNPPQEHGETDNTYNATLRNSEGNGLVLQQERSATQRP
jgi:hypothetical protein